ncbi:DNA adenine methylase [Aureimonas sp. SK2]|uniref:DNA adenine methylase n=1 Tax=Aureimonas sp. SK2 TaxID=3015992 RepID=UPI002443B234|nr:DNA adenine methylase [Aureimonas sp. SK2]
MNQDHRPVAPAAPAAGYIGGKRNLSRRLIERIDRIPHDGYAEAFVGMGGVFLRRSRQPRFEAINDRSGDVATFFRILQRHYTHFMEMLRFQISSRREFDRLTATDPDTLTDLERAARFLYLQRLAFGGKVAGRTFGVDPAQGARFNVTKLAPILEAIHERLAGVVIERLDWSEFLRRYDRPGMLFYLDPPYYGSEGDYGKDAFGRDQFALLADRLRTLRGSFLLSINDRPEVREVFAGLSMETAETTYTVGRKDPVRVGELIITGPSIPL